MTTDTLTRQLPPPASSSYSYTVLKSTHNARKNLRVPLTEIDEDKIIFYDIETDSQFATYANLKSIGWQQGFFGPLEWIEHPDKHTCRAFAAKLASPEIIKVAFNNINFDDIVLDRHGMFVSPRNRHDLFLGFKTINPNLPAFALKFIAFYYLGDPHFPEMEISNWCAREGKKLHEAPHHVLRDYNLHDVKQTEQLFRLAWDHLITDQYWWAYQEDLLIGEPLQEICSEGGLYLDRDQVWIKLQRLQKTVQQQNALASSLTGGLVENANSSKQLGKYLSEEDDIALALTDSGEFCVNKSVLVSLRSTNPLADCAYKIREANGTIKYFENYLTALDDTTWNGLRGTEWIPQQLSASSARTRRFTSQSKFHLNFQNANTEAKSVVLVPPGYLGIWWDATQVENIVHIYESQDHERRLAYESDPDWNEYVWLCNRILGGDHTKKELDSQKSPQIPNWTVYKQYKTGKLAINFGMGVKKFCVLFGLARDVGEQIFCDVHSACGAIRELQYRVGSNLRHSGFVEDVFEKRYAGPTDKAYKVVAYLIQGCGTGSLPKAQIRSNWESLRSFDRYMPRSINKCGVMTGTTHDENGCRVLLRLGSERILQLLQRQHFNMGAKFSGLFDGIPLRSKLYLSKTIESKKIECSMHETSKILTIINGSPCPECAGEGCKTCKEIGYVI